MAETRYDAHRQIAEVEDKLYEKLYESEYKRHSSRQQAAEILADDKEKVSEVRRLASKKMDEKMAEMKEIL